ncbi:hypothetical protein YO5_18227 [Stutzerimonas stutzeri TS44]|nr:hypothetical protein YO5_18227 [Stutzerimonas stutzeri TS44]
MSLLHTLGLRLARHLGRPRPGYSQLPTFAPEHLATSLRVGDVLLVEGTSRLSSTIKYLTQSTWSHAALYVGDRLGPVPGAGEPAQALIEADVVAGVRLMPLAHYQAEHTRICRPVGLNEADLSALLDYLRARLGLGYDLRNLFDLARYLIRPPLPGRLKRRMIALGSGSPTRAICSTLLAQAFESIHYPILPEIVSDDPMHPALEQARREQLHIRNYSLFVPRDFDVSPYFRIVKPQLQHHFDFHRLQWAEDE